VLQVLIDHKDRLLNEVPEDDDQGRIHLVINLLYYYASNYKKEDIISIPREQETQEKLLDAYEYEFLDAIQFWDSEHLTKLAQTFYLLNSRKFPHIWKRIEHKTIDEVKNLDSYNLTQLMRSFTRNKIYSGFGSDKLFNDLETRVIEKIDEFDMKSLSHVMHTYGFREQGSPHLHQKFLKRLESNDEKLDHQTVSNLMYYLMFTDNTNEDIWNQLVQHTLQNKLKIPVSYFTPFKFSKFYLSHHFPNNDYTDYVDQFFYPERYHSTFIQEQKLTAQAANQGFVNYLVNKFLIYPINFYSIGNAFMVRHSFREFKIGVNFFGTHELNYSERRINARQKLDSKLLGYQQWEILNMSELDHLNMDSEERDTFYREWFTQAKEKQKEKGLVYKP
jgi:hypothetical protein